MSSIMVVERDGGEWQEGERRRVQFELEGLREQVEAMDQQAQWMGRLCIRLVGMG